MRGKKFYFGGGGASFLVETAAATAAATNAFSLLNWNLSYYAFFPLLPSSLSVQIYVFSIYKYVGKIGERENLHVQLLAWKWLRLTFPRRRRASAAAVPRPPSLSISCRLRFISFRHRHRRHYPGSLEYFHNTDGNKRKRGKNRERRENITCWKQHSFPSTWHCSVITLWEKKILYYIHLVYSGIHCIPNILYGIYLYCKINNVFLANTIPSYTYYIYIISKEFSAEIRKKRYKNKKIFVFKIHKCSYELQLFHKMS